jgi:hypothetical protein
MKLVSSQKLVPTLRVASSNILALMTREFCSLRSAQMRVGRRDIAGVPAARPPRAPETADELGARFPAQAAVR